MAAPRKNTFRLSLTPGTEAELLRLQACGENEALLTRCAVWRSSPTQLEAYIVLKKQRYAYQVGESGPWGEGILLGPWQPIEFDDASWRAAVAMQGAWVRDRTQRGARTDLLPPPALPPAPPAPLNEPTNTDAAVDMPRASDPAQPDATSPPPPSQPDPPPPPPFPMPLPPHVARDDFTCAGLTPKPPRYWDTIADVLPALFVRPSPEGETPEQQAERLQLPRIDPRHAMEDDHLYAWRAKWSDSPWSPAQPGYGNAYQRFGFQMGLARFLQQLRCIVEGKSLLRGISFDPTLHRLPGPRTNSYPCPEENSPPGIPVRRNRDQACDECGAEAGFRCIDRVTYPRKGKTWYLQYETELGGAWPPYWSYGGVDGNRLPRVGYCVAERKLLQLKVLLTRMVLNCGDNLAVRALAMCSTASFQPQPLSFRGAIFFSHCPRCAQPYSNELCTPAKDSRGDWPDGASAGARATLRHDQRQPGFPLYYCIVSDTISRNLLGAPVAPSMFMGTSTGGREYNSDMFHMFHASYDPPQRGRTDRMYFDGALPRLEDSADGVLPVLPPGYLVSPPEPLGDVQQLPDAFVDNPDGKTNIFYDPYHGEFSRITGMRLDAGELLPAVNTIEEDLLWVEQRAAANGIVAPYQQPGFVPASVLPPVASRSAEEGDDGETGTGTGTGGTGTGSLKQLFDGPLMAV